LIRIKEKLVGVEELQFQNLLVFIYLVNANEWHMIAHHIYCCIIGLLKRLLLAN